MAKKPLTAIEITDDTDDELAAEGGQQSDSDIEVVREVKVGNSSSADFASHSRDFRMGTGGAHSKSARRQPPFSIRVTCEWPDMARPEWTTPDPSLTPSSTPTPAAFTGDSVTRSSYTRWPSIGEAHDEIKGTDESTRRISLTNPFRESPTPGSPFSSQISATDAKTKHRAAIQTALAQQLIYAHSVPLQGQAHDHAKGGMTVCGPVGAPRGARASVAKPLSTEKARQSYTRNTAILTPKPGKPAIPLDKTSSCPDGLIQCTEETMKSRRSVIKQHVRDAFHNLRGAVRKYTQAQNKPVKDDSDDSQDDRKKSVEEQRETDTEIIAAVRDGSFQRALLKAFPEHEDVASDTPAMAARLVSLPVWVDKELETLREDVQRLRDEKAMLINRVCTLLEEKAGQTQKEAELMKRIEEFEKPREQEQDQHREQAGEDSKGPGRDGLNEAISFFSKNV